MHPAQLNNRGCVAAGSSWLACPVRTAALAHARQPGMGRLSAGLLLKPQQIKALAWLLAAAAGVFAVSKHGSASMLDSTSCDALDSDDPVYASVPLRRAAVLQYQNHHQHQQLPHIDMQQVAMAAAEHSYPLIAAAHWVAAAGLLAAPQFAVQIFGAVSGVGFGMDPLLATFAQLLSGAYILQGAVALLAKVGGHFWGCQPATSCDCSSAWPRHIMTAQQAIPCVCGTSRPPSKSLCGSAMN